MRTLKDSFRLYFTGLRAALSSTPSMPKAHIAFIDRVWRYVLGLSGRLDRLITRWNNGTLPRPCAPRPGRARKPRTPPAFRLPRGRKWLIRRMPGTGIGVFGGQLEHLLANDQQFAAFLEAAPQARRLLGPVCRMFGVALPAAPGVTPPVTPGVTPPAAPAVTPPAAPAVAVEAPPAAPAPSASPLPAPGPAQSAEPAPNPPLVFSSA